MNMFSVSGGTGWALAGPGEPLLGSLVHPPSGLSSCSTIARAHSRGGGSVRSKSMQGLLKPRPRTATLSFLLHFMGQSKAQVPPRFKDGTHSPALGGKCCSHITKSMDTGEGERLWSFCN